MTPTRIKANIFGFQIFFKTYSSVSLLTSATIHRDVLLLEWSSTIAILRGIRRELEINTSTHNLISATKDEFPRITSENVGLNWLCKEDGTCLDFFSYHCAIYWYAVCKLSDER
jgi:hypothetical protein